MKTVKKFSITTAVLAILMVCSLSGWAQLGKIYGTVATGQDVMPGEKVELWKNGNPTGRGMLTNEKGKFEFSMIEPGTYTVKVFTLEHTVVQDVTVSTGEYKPIEFQMAMGDGDDDGPGIGTGDVIIFDSKTKLFSVDPMIQITFTGDQMQEGGPGRGIADFASLAPGMVQKDAGDPLNFKGGRSDANATYIDCMKLRGTDEMPLGAIEQMTVITGGLPAEYGDVMGAVIVVTTRNPGMTMGHVGKPLTKSEKQLNKQIRKRGNQEGGITPTIEDLACN